MLAKRVEAELCSSFLRQDLGQSFVPESFVTVLCAGSVSHEHSVVLIH